MAPHVCRVRRRTRRRARANPRELEARGDRRLPRPELRQVGKRVRSRVEERKRPTFELIHEGCKGRGTTECIPLLEPAAAYVCLEEDLVDAIERPVGHRCSQRLPFERFHIDLEQRQPLVPKLVHHCAQRRHAPRPAHLAVGASIAPPDAARLHSLAVRARQAGGLKPDGSRLVHVGCQAHRRVEGVHRAANPLRERAAKPKVISLGHGFVEGPVATYPETVDDATWSSQDALIKTHRPSAVIRTVSSLTPKLRTADGSLE